jgi:hypothetical protein
VSPALHSGAADLSLAETPAHTMCEQFWRGTGCLPTRAERTSACIARCVNLTWVQSNTAAQFERPASPGNQPIYHTSAICPTGRVVLLLDWAQAPVCTATTL